jgi:hypothetical protein
VTRIKKITCLKNFLKYKQVLKVVRGWRYSSMVKFFPNMHETMGAIPITEKRKIVEMFRNKFNL